MSVGCRIAAVTASRHGTGVPIRIIHEPDARRSQAVSADYQRFDRSASPDIVSGYDRCFAAVSNGRDGYGSGSRAALTSQSPAANATYDLGQRLRRTASHDAARH